MVSPVPRVGSGIDARSSKGRGTGGRAVLLSVRGVILEVEVVGELLVGHGRELVDSTSVSLVLFAVVLDDGIDIVEESNHGFLVQLDW